MSKPIPETPVKFDATRIVERPDGFYWTDSTTGEAYGPFATLAEAALDMEYQEDSDFEPAESLEEAEDELGITSWVDPDTGELAEDTFTHLEDH
ncbi:hypothetical protein EZJ19_09395 [Parasulfuritortus cantonensis]|uniref:Uncharacterized protein n=1 Tax=Parasulfuritortus cantonensis TaxID=2528202 RepID=A0A4V2NVS8_9PROT|nr:hypothetical protein [Parasulfuritortus cantonensis]TCJ14652.1 hypothetical protein EZJ19_09395 [Parasulfuritortus cantonensis]